MWRFLLSFPFIVPDKAKKCAALRKCCGTSKTAIINTIFSCAPICILWTPYKNETFCLLLSSAVLALEWLCKSDRNFIFWSRIWTPTRGTWKELWWHASLLGNQNLPRYTILSSFARKFRQYFAPLHPFPMSRAFLNAWRSFGPISIATMRSNYSSTDTCPRAKVKFGMLLRFHFCAKTAAEKWAKILGRYAHRSDCKKH